MLRKVKKTLGFIFVPFFACTVIYLLVKNRLNFTVRAENTKRIYY